ncbi:unnamed protein product [Adineta ricciae]|uniref:Uncharacterized protein n=1 Tax=Adineta ricciae TaxID=249248 RepID=A0A814XBD4_ADIRI|nr:unnamed protein product [Adineta ricciae]
MRHLCKYRYCLKVLEASSRVNKDTLHYELQKIHIHYVEAVKENIPLNFDIEKIHSKTTPKSAKRKHVSIV